MSFLAFVEVANITHRASQPTIVRVTRSAASCWTKWPAPGIVTKVRSLSSQFQVSLSAPGRRAWSFRPWIKSTEHFTVGKVGDGRLGRVRVGRIGGCAGIVGFVVVEHSFH